MIGKLTGLIDEIEEDRLILNVGGVGYIVFLSSRQLGTLGAHKGEISFYIESLIREDAHRLFGFATKEERNWFRLLQNVQGVGAKVALALLGSLTSIDLSNAIALRDIEMLCRAPGVGKKVAERIVTELKSKNLPLSATMGEEKNVIIADQSALSQPIIDAVSALQKLGYTREQATRAVMRVAKEGEESYDSATLIRIGLKELAQL